jgi:hypothetical protein
MSSKAFFTMSLLAAGWVLLGCGLWSARRAGDYVGITREDFKNSCSQCHEAPRGRDKTDEEWQEFMMEHRFMTGHDRETAQLFADYLKREN